MGGIASREQLRMGLVRWAAVTVPLVLLLGFGSGASVRAGDDSPWYVALAKPAATPPDWVFPIAWGLIYVCLGLAVALVLHARGARGRAAGVSAFTATLLLSAAWMPVFFGAHRLSAATAVALGMVGLGTLTAVLFGRVRPLAAWLMVPFLVWISYAAVLTWSIERLNPGADGLAPAPAASQVIG